MSDNKRGYIMNEKGFTKNLIYVMVFAVLLSFGSLFAFLDNYRQNVDIKESNIGNTNVYNFEEKLLRELREHNKIQKEILSELKKYNKSKWGY